MFSGKRTNSLEIERTFALPERTKLPASIFKLNFQVDSALVLFPFGVGAGALNLALFAQLAKIAKISSR